MSRSPSGRIVIEIEPEVKQRLHALLALQGTTLKSWFLERVDDYMEYAEGVDQLPLGLQVAIIKGNRAKEEK